MTNILIARAEEYLELAQYALSKKMYSQTCFLSSVASELYMKGVSLAISGDFTYFHDGKQILSYIRNIDSKLAEMIDNFVKENREKLRRLASEYTIARYDMELIYEREDAEMCIRIAKQI
ncbi:DNA-binding protein, partial [Sulfolobus sp. B1]